MLNTASSVLMLSSSLYIIPCVYAYNNKDYIFSALLLSVSLISINYWRNPEKGFRRNLDLVFSKLMICVGSYHAAKYITTLNQKLLTYPGFILTIYTYNKSSSLHVKKDNNWYKYHSLMHIVTTYESYIIIYNIKRSNYTSNSNTYIITNISIEFLLIGLMIFMNDKNKEQYIKNPLLVFNLLR